MRKLPLLLLLFSASFALRADRYSWVQPWTAPLQNPPKGRSSFLYLAPLDWVQGRLNGGYEHYLSGSVSVFVGVLLQSSVVTPPFLRGLWQQREYMGGMAESGVSYIWPGWNWAEGLRSDLTLTLGYMHLYPTSSLPLAGIRGRIGYQFNLDGFTINPFWSVQLFLALSEDEDAEIMVRLASGQFFFVPAIPGLNRSEVFAISGGIWTALSMGLGLRIGLPLSPW